LKEITVKTSFVTAALIIASGLSATASFAADSAPLSRAQVRSEVLQARANGTMPATGDVTVTQETSVPSTLTRGAVKSDFLQAQKAGTLPYKGDSLYVPETSVTSTLTRSAVKSELLQAQKTGMMPATGERS
jgi:uncharacterized protein (DUF427 family)